MSQMNCVLKCKGELMGGGIKRVKTPVKFVI